MTEAVQADPAAETRAPADDYVPFWEFFSELFIPEMNIQIPLKAAHRKVCDTLEDAFLGELPPGIEYVIINIGPRIGKSMIARACVAWGEGEFPDSQFIYTSYGAQLAEESLAFVKKTMSAAWYREIYGDLIHGQKADHLTTVDGGNVYGEGTGGSLTGKGAGLKVPCGGLLIIDDASKPDEALSPVETKKKQQWVETTCKNRRNSDLFCPIVIIGQRLGPEDVPGYFLANYPEKCLLVKIPALVDPETGEASNADNAISAFPETVSTSTLLDYRKTRVGRFVLASQYQQNPTSLGGNLIPTGSFHRWNPATPMKWMKTVITVDTALKTKQANDFSALALWGLFERKAYLIDIMHGKWETPGLITNSASFWRKWTREGVGIPRPRFIIEEKAAGTPLLQSLRQPQIGIPATGIERDIDKVRRVQSILQFIETGMVVIPQDGSVPWIEKFVTECDEFKADGTAVHDDMVDTMVDALEELLGKPTSIFDVLLTSQTRR